MIDDIEAWGAVFGLTLAAIPIAGSDGISSKTRFSWLTLVVLGLPNSPICDNSRG